MKKVLAACLIAALLLSPSLVSCTGGNDGDDGLDIKEPSTNDKEDNDNNTGEDDSKEDPDQNKEDPDRDENDQDDNKDPSGGGLNVGEDTDDNKWGDFIPYE